MKIILRGDITNAQKRPRISAAEELMQLPKNELILIRSHHPSLVGFWQLLERAREVSTPAV